jgi:hypothetical protein
MRVEVRNQENHLITDKGNTSVVDTLDSRLTSTVDKKNATIAKKLRQRKLF